MGSPINRAPLTAAQTNLVNGEVSDAPVLEAVIENTYDYVDGLNAEINAHTAATTLPHADGSVTTSKIRDGAVTEPKLATGAVTVNKIGSSAVTTDKVAATAITEPKLATGAVSSRTIAKQAVQAQHIDPALFAPYPDTAIWAKFAQVDQNFVDIAPLLSVLQSGGIQDNVTALNNFLSSVTGTVRLTGKNGNKIYGVSGTVIVPTGVYLDLGGCTIKALTGFNVDAPVIRLQGASRLLNGWIEAELLTKYGVVRDSGATVRIQNLNVNGATLKGIDSSTSIGACNLDTVNVALPVTYTASLSSIGIDMACPDSTLDKCIVSGYAIGIKNLGQNNHLSKCHPWCAITSDSSHVTMIAGFICGGVGSTYSQCYSDSARTSDGLVASNSNPGFGYWITATNQTLTNCTSFMPYSALSTYADNTAIGFWVESGFNAIIGGINYAMSPTKRIYQDYAGPGLSNVVLWPGFSVNTTTQSGAIMTVGVARMGMFNAQAAATQLPIRNTNQDGSSGILVSMQGSGQTGGGITRYGSTHADVTYRNSTVLESRDATKMVIHSDFAPIYFDIGSKGNSKAVVRSANFEAVVPIIFPSYASGSRPTGSAGMTIRDSTLNKLITHDGTNWRDQSGTVV